MKMIKLNDVGGRGERTAVKSSRSVERGAKPCLRASSASCEEKSSAVPVWDPHRMRNGTPFSASLPAASFPFFDVNQKSCLFFSDYVIKSQM